jgi:hypothetical protein
MNPPATSTYLPPLAVNHEREEVGEQWMLRAQLGENV